MSDDYIKTLENENVRLRDVILRQQNDIDSLNGPKKVSNNTNISNNIIVIDSLNGAKSPWNVGYVKKCKKGGI